MWHKQVYKSVGVHSGSMPGATSAAGGGLEGLLWYASLSVSSNWAAVLKELTFTSSYKSDSCFAGSENVTSVLGGCKTDSYTCSCKFRIFLLLFFLNTKHITIVKAAIIERNAKLHASTTTSTVTVLLFSTDSVGRSVQIITHEFMIIIMYFYSTIFIDDSGGGSFRFQVNIRWNYHANDTA